MSAADTPGEIWPPPLASPMPLASRSEPVAMSSADCELQVRCVAALIDRLSDLFTSSDERAIMKREAVMLSLQGRLCVRDSTNVTESG